MFGKRREEQSPIEKLTWELPDHTGPSLTAALTDRNISLTSGDAGLAELLIEACGMGRADLVSVLMPIGLNIRDECGETPLVCAIQSENAELVRWMLNAGADPNMPGAGGYPPLAWAMLCGVFEVFPDLLRAGADINSPIEVGTNLTLLHLAAINDIRPAIPHLLSNGLNWELRDAWNHTGRDTAVRQGFGEFVRLLDATITTREAPKR